MIYLDYNATTPLCAPALEAMLPFLERHHGNPSSIHAAGREARAGVDDARDRLADLLGAKPHELIFTSGGTESNNLAVLGLARAHAPRGRHLICASTEHHAVLHAFEHLGKREGFDVTILPVDEQGLIDPEELESAIRDDTTLVSIMSANNETGVLQPMEELARLCEERAFLLHSDMVQSFGKVKTDLAESGLAAASFAGLSSETILMALDLEGVCASSGSACMVGSVVASHVLLAMGLPERLAGSAVRFSLGQGTSQEEIERAGEIIARVMSHLRATSSSYTYAAV